MGLIITKGLIVYGLYNPMGPIKRRPIKQGRMKRGRVVIAPYALLDYSYHVCSALNVYTGQNPRRHASS
jgi:hypothetical protein